MIGFDPSNVYALLYGTQKYGDILIFPYMGYCIEAYVWLLIFVFFLVTHSYFPPYSICVWLTIFIFKLVIFSNSYCLHRLIYSQSDTNGVFNIMSRPKNSWPGVACNMLWYVLHITKTVAAIIPAQGLSLSM